MAKATVIKPKQYKSFSNKPVGGSKKVAAYCRVSSEKDEQKNSYEAQVSYYTEYIQSKKDWMLADIYADQGISGTNTDKREDFHRMIKDAKDGKVDLILTKSISRFARNTVDTLRYTRELKNIGVAVMFEKENINTLEASGELMMTIFSSLAQEESRSISQNVRWGIVKGFKDGKIHINSKRFLGYDKTKDGKLVINEEEAKIVKRIYKEYLEGKSSNAIAKGLEKDQIPTVTGNKKWWDSSVTIILTNEKYYGALLQQKTVTVDYLSHKRVKNKGYADQYLIEDNHQAIIPKEIWDKVQKEKECRAILKGNIKGDRGKYSSKYPFSGKIICGKCGNTFRRRTWNSTNKSKKIVWQCKTYIKEGKKACDAKAVDEAILEKAFVDIFNDIMEGREEFIHTLEQNIEKVFMKINHEIDIEKLNEDIEKVKQEIKSLVRLQMVGNIDDEIYNEEYTRLQDNLNKLRDEKNKLKKDDDKRKEIKKKVEDIIKLLNERDTLLIKFDKDIFNALVDRIEILKPTHFVFVLKSGMRIEKILKNNMY